MIASARRLAELQGVGRRPGGGLADVLAGCPLLPSRWAGQDVLAAWARGGPEDPFVIEQAVDAGDLERVWGPRGDLWTATPQVARDIRIAYRHLEDSLDVDPALAERLVRRWDVDQEFTVGQVAGVLGCDREEAGRLLQRGCVRAEVQPMARDDRGRLRFRRRDPEGTPGTDVGEVVEQARARLAPVLEAVLVPDGAEARPLPGAAGGSARHEGGVPLALLGRGDPFASVASVDEVTEWLRRPSPTPPVVVVHGALVGTWSETWVRDRLHVDVTVALSIPSAWRAVLEDRVASLGRLRHSGSTRWRVMTGDHDDQ